MSRPFLTAGAIWGVVLAGCSQPQATLWLDQPEVDGPQQSLHLTSDRAWHRAGGRGEVAGACEGEGSAVLLEFPLPGSRLGSVQYLVYLRMPLGLGTHAVGHTLNGGQVVSGLLLQRTGRLRGMTAFSDGSVTVEKMSPLTVRLNVACADQTVVRGSFRAADGSVALARFERGHRADIDRAERVAMQGRRSGTTQLGADGMQARAD